MIWLLIFLIVSFLILVNALYVAAEFSTVSARRSRLAQLAAEGDASAQALIPIIEDPNRLDNYIATCQLGITISSLLLGFYAQGSVADALAPLLVGRVGFSEVAVRSILATVVLLFFTVLQALLGELVPKNIGLQYPERLALLTSLPLRWSMTVFRPLIWFFNGSGRLLMRLVRLNPVSEGAHVHSPQEILMLVEESSAGGLLASEERRLLENTLQLRESLVRQVMIPRTRVLSRPVDRPCEELLSELAESNFSRMPLYRRSIDDVVGVVHLKDLLCLSRTDPPHDVTSILRPVRFVPETMPVEQVFTRLQHQRDHVAIVLDEYGGTAGMVTLEDLIEEIFGDLQDEFDPVIPRFRMMSEDRLVVRGDVLVKDLNEWLHLYLPSEEVDTIGGLVLNEIGHVPRVGEEIQMEDLTLRVEGMAGKGVSAVSMPVTPELERRLRRMAP